MMTDMHTYNISLAVRLDRAVTDDQARAAARSWADMQAMTLVLTSTGLDEPRMSVSAAVRDAETGPAASVQGHCDSLRQQLATVGLTVVSWDAIEVLSPEESERRLRNASLPAMVSAQELAQLCGVAPSRIYELESERKKAAEAGERHAFPTPVVPGYWLKSVAEHYASTRKRRPGPAARAAS